MSKTVLLPDDLHKEIQDIEINVSWTYQDMSIAKKIKIFFDYYRLEQEWLDELNKLDNNKIKNQIHDAYIRWQENFSNPWLIK